MDLAVDSPIITKLFMQGRNRNASVILLLVVVYFDKKYIEHKAHIKCTIVKNYKTHIHKMKAKYHVISTRDNTKSK